jgi:hypothetical protein
MKGTKNAIPEMSLKKQGIYSVRLPTQDLMYHQRHFREEQLNVNIEREVCLYKMLTQRSLGS